MDYIKLGTRYYRDPALQAANDRTRGQAEVLFLRGLSLCGADETEGLVARSSLVFLGVKGAEKVAAVLVEEKLWELTDDGWRYRSWDKWQSEHDALARRKKAERERKRAQRERDAATADPDSDPPPSRDRSRDGPGGGSRDVTPHSARVNRDGDRDRERTTDEAKASSRREDREDVIRLCDHLARRIAEHGSRKPAVTQRWREAARLLLDRDGRTEAQVHAAIDWCQDDPFWTANILSMPKLREKYDQLRLQAQRGTGKQTVTHVDTWQAAKELDRQLAEQSATVFAEIHTLLPNVEDV